MISAFFFLACIGNNYSLLGHKMSIDIVSEILHATCIKHCYSTYKLGLACW